MSLIPTFIWLGADGARIVFATMIALFIMFTHRSNIVAMLNGSEYRFRKVWIKTWLDRDRPDGHSLEQGVRVKRQRKC